MQALSQLSYRPINYYLIIITVFCEMCNFFIKVSHLPMLYYTKKEPRDSRALVKLRVSV